MNLSFTGEKTSGKTEGKAADTVDKFKRKGSKMEYNNSVDRLNRVLVRVHRFLQGELLKQGVDDLVPSHGAVLEYLHHAGTPQPVTELVLALRRPKSSITKATDCLEHGGYIFKKPNPSDGRSFLVGLTPEGKAALTLFHNACNVLEERLYSGISSERRESCLQTLEDMEENLKQV